VSPKGDLVLCKVAEAEEQTTGGLLLPNSAQTKPTSGCYAGLGTVPVAQNQLLGKESSETVAGGSR